jgi:hypothetical protein
MAERFRNKRLTGGGEDTHELFGGAEGVAFGKCDFDVRNLLKIGGEGGEMVGVVPCPGWTALVIVEEYPAESFDVVLYESGR